MKAIEIEIKHYQLKNSLLIEGCIATYLKDIITDFKKCDTWKIYLEIPVNFISSKDTGKEHVMHSKSYNINLMIIGKEYEVTEKLFQSFFF